MSPAATLRAAREAGISVAATPAGTLKVTGETATIARLAPALRTHKAAILELLTGGGAKPLAKPAIAKAGGGIKAASRYGSKGGPAMEPYREAWKRLQSRQPKWSSPEEWRQALDDAAAIFATWGELAVEFRWQPEAILGKGGLAWFTAGEAVRSFGPEHAVTVSGRVFDRCPPGVASERFGLRDTNRWGAGEDRAECDS